MTDASPTQRVADALDPLDGPDAPAVAGTLPVPVARPAGAVATW